MDFLPHCSFLSKLCHLHPELIIRKKIPPNFAFWGSNKNFFSTVSADMRTHLNTCRDTSAWAAQMCRWRCAKSHNSNP